MKYAKSCRGVSWGVSLVVSGSGSGVLTHHEYGCSWVRDARHRCWAFLRCRGPYSTKHWWRKVPAWKPQWNSHKKQTQLKKKLCRCCCILLLRFYGWAVMLLCQALVGYRQHMWYCEWSAFTDPRYNMWRRCALLLLYPDAQDLWLGSCYTG